MPDISKLSGVAIANVAKVDAVTKANIADINGLTIPSAGYTPILDDYTDGLMAVSVRKLRTAYTGDCMRVREAGSNTEADIGFDSNGLVDTAAIASHCGSNDGFLRTWYTQIGSINPGTTTASLQIKIYDGATQAVLLDNGIPTTSFSGQYYPLNANQQGSITTAMVIHVDAGESRYTVHGDYTVFQAYKNNATTTGVPADTYYVNGTAQNPSTGGEVFTSLGTDQIVLVHYEDAKVSIMGTSGNINRYTGFVQEMIVWDSIKNATDRAGIESNITDYFSIT